MLIAVAFLIADVSVHLASSYELRVYEHAPILERRLVLRQDRWVLLRLGRGRVAQHI